VNTDLSYYNWIIACEGEPVTSMERILGREIPLEEVEVRLIRNFEDVFEMTGSGKQTEGGCVKHTSTSDGNRNAVNGEKSTPSQAITVLD
jgi:lipoate-protein ligase B